MGVAGIDRLSYGELEVLLEAHPPLEAHRVELLVRALPMRGTVVCRVLILLLFFVAGSPPGFAQGNQPAGVGASDPRQPQGDIGDFPESEKPLGLVLKDDGSAFRSLMMAIGLEDGEALGELLSSGVSPDSADPESGLTALMIADTREMAELLLDHGADPALVDDEGATALHHALFAREAKEHG